MVSRSLFKRKRWFYACLAAVALLLAVALALPVAARFYLNQYVLNDMGEYRGHVEDIQLHWLKGAYVLNNLKVLRKGSEKDTPFFQVEELRFSLSLSDIVRGDFAFSAWLKKPALNFMDARREEDRQTGKGGNWLDAVESIVPETLSRIDIEDGVLTFKNPDSQPKVDVRADKLNAVVRNMTNVENKTGDKVARAQLTGRVLKQGEVAVDVDFDPNSFNDFDFKLEATDLHLDNLNDVSRVYASLDFESGQGEIYSEINAADGQIDGYVKPMFSDINILSWEQDVEEQGDNPVQFLWEGLAGGIKTAFTSFSSGKFATKIDLSGSIERAEMSATQAFFEIVKNAFVQPLKSGFASEDRNES